MNRRVQGPALLPLALCLVLVACSSQAPPPPSLASLMREAWLEQDTQGVFDPVSCAVKFLGGFAPPGDSGWVMRGFEGVVSLRAVSGFARVVELDVTVPPPGGRLAVRGPRASCLDTVLPPGRSTARFTVLGSSLTRDEAEWRLCWTPQSQLGSTTGRFVVRDVRVLPIGRERLATVAYDSSSNTLTLGPGCAVTFNVRAGEKPRLTGTVQGPRGTVLVRTRTDGSGMAVPWTGRLSGTTLSFDAELAQGASGSLIEVTLETSRFEEGATWTDLSLVDVLPVGVDMEPSPDPGPVQTSIDRPLNVILYLVDTLRRDHLQVHGYPLPTTPFLAADSSAWCVFEDCQSLSSWTRASTASLLTAKTPMEHLTVDEDDSLPTTVPLIWESFREAGYLTAFLTTNGNVSDLWGFHRGLDFYRFFVEDDSTPWLHCPADSIHRALLQWIDAQKESGKPFFAYVHATDPHIPYTPPLDLIPLFYPPGIPPMTTVSLRKLSEMICPGRYEPWEVDAVRALYDAEIAGWDRAFALFLDALKMRGLLDRTIIVLTSDHGEEFAEHGGFSHGTTLYGEQVRIPLMVRAPGFRGGRVTTPIDHRDVASLLQWLLSGKDPKKWDPTPRRHRESYLALRGIVMARLDHGTNTLIWNIRPLAICDRPLPDLELYVDDRLEKRNLWEQYPASASAWRAVLAAWVTRGERTAPAAVTLDRESVERLRLLGYMVDELGPHGGDR